MSRASRVMFCLIALGLSFISPASSLFQSLASTPSTSQLSDEETLRRMTEQYALAIAAGDLEAIRRFWNPQSPNLASRLWFYRNPFSDLRIEFISLEVTRLEIRDSRAVLNLTTDERWLDKKTGAILTINDALHGVCRSFEWIKTDAGWKIEREFLIQDDLASRLVASSSEQERDELLEKDKLFVTDALVRSLDARIESYTVRLDFDAALRCIQMQKAVAEKIGDQAGVAVAALNFGYLKEAQDDYELALPPMQEALARFEAAGFVRGVALALEKISYVYHSLGDHRQALNCAQKSLRLYEEANNRRGTVQALTRLGNIYGAHNNSRQALTYLEKALTIAQEVGDKVQIILMRHFVATQYAEIGDYERALEIHQEILKQIESYGDRAGAGMIRSEIGRVFAAQGRYAEALVYHHQAVTDLEAANKRGSVALELIYVSDAYLARGEYTEALPAAQRAVSMLRQTGRQLDLWRALTSLGYGQLGLNRPQEARQSFAEAVSIIEKLRAQTTGGVEDRQRHFEGGLRAHHGLLSLMVKENQSQEALVFAERAKARALLDMLQQGWVSVQKAMTGEEQEQERRLKSELTRLNMQLNRATQSDKPDAKRIIEIEPRLEKARLSYEAFQNSLYAAHPELKVKRGEAPIIKAEELAALLPDGASALLEYVVADDETYLFTVTKMAAKAEVEVRVYTLPIKRDDLAKKTEAFRQQLAGRDLGFRASAVKLYDLLLKPAAAQLRGKTNLVIAPDDTLWDLPFQALMTGAQRFLIEDAAIAYAPSLTVLREMTKRHRNQSADAGSKTLLALGNPLVEKETVNRAALTLRNGKLDPLPEAEQEVKALSRLYGTRSKIYIGAEAREERVKSEAGQARILHFAAHGMLNNASPMYSHLALAEGGASEDGLLEAWELMQLDLKAELAVLSACETARGRIGAGEGMVGFSWAMFIAGVPSIVVTQWKVESASTRDLMVNFHRALILQKAKPTKTEALRQAALKLLKNPETRHPFYWAGFVLVGDGG
ncbi:MAG: CHAT domain-containing tetratricopeptide repeat protein [Blastocatellia bacterium]